MNNHKGHRMGREQPSQGTLVADSCLQKGTQDDGWQKNTQDGDLRICASCGSTSELVVDDPNSLAVFCGECSSPISLLDFPEYYCDLGGSG